MKLIRVRWGINIDFKVYKSDKEKKKGREDD